MPEDHPPRLFASILDRALAQKPGWEHPALLTLVQDLTPRQALYRPETPQRPSSESRCVWELLLHMHGWQAHVARRLGGEPSTYNNPWPGLPEGIEQAPAEDQRRAWDAMLDRLRATHTLLVSRVAALDPAERYPHEDLADLPHWMSAVFTQLHDSYHAGQIALLRGLQGLAAVE